MEQRRSLGFGGAVSALLVSLTVACGDAQIPVLQVDPFWPQPLEYPSILGPISGVTVAPDGNILVVTRQDGFSAVNEINSVTGTGTCCTPLDGVVEFAPDGRLVRQWGGPDRGTPWPETPHGIAIDPEGNVWIGGGSRTIGGGPGGGGGAPTVDTQILKFSREGNHLATFDGFQGAGRFSFDARANEAYVADGYAGSRVAVIDISTGEVKREWGANGPTPFSGVACAALSNDGHVYVCDRGNNRIQVFRTDGTFVAEQTIAPATGGEGSVWDIAFSSDSGQSFLYVPDGVNERVYVLDRGSLAVLESFGTGGRVPGTFRAVGSVAVDAQGNVFTAENGQGRRVQRFQNVGSAPAPAQVEHLGALGVWPGN